jgi:16S rRNA processing protein RimM
MSPSKQNNLSPDHPKKGSPTPGEPLYISIGRFGRPFSYKGAVLFYPDEDYGSILKDGITLYMGDEKSSTKVVSSKPHGKGLLVHIDGCQTDIEAAKLTNQRAYLPKEELPMPQEGKYYHHQILGMQVVDGFGAILGTLDEVLVTGANDVFVVKSGDGKEFLFPVIDSVVKKVDLEKGVILVEPQAWD